MYFILKYKGMLGTLLIGFYTINVDYCFNFKTMYATCGNIQKL